MNSTNEKWKNTKEISLNLISEVLDLAFIGLVSGAILTLASPLYIYRYLFDYNGYCSVCKKKLRERNKKKQGFISKYHDFSEELRIGYFLEQRYQLCPSCNRNNEIKERIESNFENLVEETYERIKLVKQDWCQGHEPDLNLVGNSKTPDYRDKETIVLRLPSKKENGIFINYGKESPDKYHKIEIYECKTCGKVYYLNNRAEHIEDIISRIKPIKKTVASASEIVTTIKYMSYFEALDLLEWLDSIPSREERDQQID